MTIGPTDLSGFGRDIDFGYINRDQQAPQLHNPRLVLNSATTSMLRALRYEIRHATSFSFSVAFISQSAIALLKQDLRDFEGVGRITTSNYLGFNSPRAFSELLNLTNLGIDVRLHNKSAFHPKGYVFKRPDGITAILGSSNLTDSALARNHEWNLRVSASRDSDLAAQFTNLIDEEFFESVPLTQSWIDDYAKSYVPPTARSTTSAAVSVRESLEVPASVPAPADLDYIVPNAMQVEALLSIESSRIAGHQKALVISATGTGKTILSALHVRQVSPGRMLFIAHREQILDRAMREYQRVLGGPSSDYGKLAGNTRQGDRRYVFATVQTLSQPGTLVGFDPHEFDYLLIDEVHRAGAASFGPVIDHFRPKFFLGMTATPERMDGENIFELFDYNVPYEIRLKRALELNMLSPFHYYGVTDFVFDDGLTTTEATPLSQLIAPDRVSHVLTALNIYAQAGVAPRGLIFCSRKDEAHELAKALNEQNFRGNRLRTRALTGEDSILERERVVEQLESGELDYILTVDIFNEGVDIPSLNQVVMLRQTQSSIVFVQQLGRGLRNAPGKDYVVVIDFIGNYANNYMIPIALFGNDSLNKESLRKDLIAAEEVGLIAGLSSIHFDRVSQERVLSSLTQTTLDSWKSLKAAIITVQARVGRAPKLSDFLRFESVDPRLLATKVNNYPELLAKLLQVDTGLSPAESRWLTVVSGELFTAKRQDELFLLQLLLVHSELSSDEVARLFTDAGLRADPDHLAAVVRSLSLEFNTAPEKAKLGATGVAVESSHGTIVLNPDFDTSYRSSIPFRAAVDDLIETGLSITQNRFDSERAFVVGSQYSRKDASRQLDWVSNMSSTIYGYRVDKATKTCPIFVTLHKSTEISASTAYEDELLSPQTMLWFTRSNRTLVSAEVAAVVQNDVVLHVFAKKDDAEGTGHYYLGRARSSDAGQTLMAGANGQSHSVVRMHLNFEQPVDAALFDYFRMSVTG